MIKHWPYVVGLIGVILVLFGMNCDADASSTTLPTTHELTGKRITESLRIAHEMYGRDPVCMVKVYSASPTAIRNSTAGNQPATIAATSVDPSVPGKPCPIWVNSAMMVNDIWARVQVCDALVHDVGHRLGYQHDDALRPGSVMNADTPTVRGCYIRFVPLAKRRWYRDTYGDPTFARRPA